jgi:hypothetical protein
MESERIEGDTFGKLEEMKDNFDDILAMLVNTLKELAVVSSSHHLFHLSQRMVSCTYKDKYEVTVEY